MAKKSNLVVTPSEVLKKVKRASAVSQEKGTIQSLACALISAKNGVFRITATDTSEQFDAVAHIASTESLEPVLVNAKKLADICSKVPQDQTIELIPDAGKMVVKAGRSKFSIAAFPAADLPLFKSDAPDIVFTTSQDHLARLISSTLFAVPIKDVRYYLCGLMLEIMPDSIHAVGTDGHRLAMCTLECSTGAKEKHSVIIPKSGADGIMSLISSSSRPVEISISKNAITVKADDDTFTSKLIEGNYPDYKRVIPKENDIRIFAEKEDLLNAISCSSVTSDKEYGRMKFAISGDELVLTANNMQQESTESSIKIDYSGKPLEFYASSSYVVDALKSVSLASVVIELGGADSPVIIKDPAMSDVLFLVMPMRV